MDIDYLVKKYNKLVYKICYNILASSMDAQDITQEVYLSLFKHQNTYKELTENEIKNVICKIALNKCRDVLKSKQKKLEEMTDQNILSLQNYQADNNIEKEIFEKERSEMLKSEINKLKKPYNRLLYDYYIMDMSLDTLATKNKVRKQILKMQLYRGKKILKESLEKIGGAKLL